MAEHVHVGFYFTHTHKQFLAADMTPVKSSISDTVRRAVRDEHVRVRRYQLPFPPQRFAAGQIEGPVQKLRLIGASVESYTVYLQRFIFEIGGVG